MRQDRSTWSMGWPSPRSVARENAPTRSANRTPLSADGRTVWLVIYATGRAAICGVNPGRRSAARSVRSASGIVEQEDAMSTVRDPAAQPAARWSVGGVFLEALATRDY